MIEELIPAPAATAEELGDPPGAVEALYPEEAASVARAVPKRRNEYATARVCARRALTALGLPPVPVLSSRRGAPQWPAGVVGSMTHCDGYRAAALAHAGDLASIGLDAEPNAPLPEGVLDSVSLEPERKMLASLPGGPDPVHWDRLLFSAKESVFKVWYPLTLKELDFHEAELVLDPQGGGFTARLLVPGPVLGGREIPVFHGRWLCRKGLLLTAITLPHPGVDA